MNDPHVAAAVGGQRYPGIGGHGRRRWQAGDDLDRHPCLGAGRGVGGRTAEQERIPAVQPDRQLTSLGRLHQQPRVIVEGRGVGDGGLRRQQVPDPAGDLRAGHHQVSLAEQGGGAQRQQPFVTRARADEGHPARGRLRRRAACWLDCLGYGVHLSSSPLLMCPSDTAMYRPAPRRSSSAATSRPRLLASAAGPAALARSTVPPFAATTTACSRKVSAPAAYAPTGALQPACSAASTLRSAVVAALLTGSSAQASTTAATSPDSTARSRVPALPRTGTGRRSGRSSSSWAARRGEPVPIRAAEGRSASFAPSRAASASRGSSRCVTAASVMPSAGLAGRSFSECTAKSISPCSRHARRPLTNTPVPPIWARSARLTSPNVVIPTSSTWRPVRSVTRLATRWDWASAIGLLRVPSRSGALVMAPPDYPARAPAPDPPGPRPAPHPDRGRRAPAAPPRTSRRRASRPVP